MNHQFKPGDLVEIRLFAPDWKPGSPGVVRSVFENGDYLVAREDAELPDWTPRLGRFEACDVFPRQPAERPS